MIDDRITDMVKLIDGTLLEDRVSLEVVLVIAVKYGLNY